MSRFSGDGTGYGFIRVSGRNDCWFGKSAAEGRVLQNGDAVSFVYVTDENGKPDPSNRAFRVWKRTTGDEHVTSQQAT
jgi:cold shock CspA family protein